MNTTPLSLLQRIRNDRDQDAWREFDAIYRPLLQRYARACGARSADLDDIVQSAMAAIHAHIRTFEHDARVGRFRAWLRTMVLNRVRNQAARRRPQAADPEELNRSTVAHELPEQEFERIWWSEHLSYYLGQIRTRVDPRTYEAFHDHVIRQQTVEEVCLRFNLTPGTLYQIKWRLTRMLREHMRKLIDDDE